MSRFDPTAMVREGSRHYQRNVDLGAWSAVKVCKRADDTLGVAWVARRLMVVMTPAEAVAIADGLVDAAEAIEAGAGC